MTDLASTFSSGEAIAKPLSGTQRNSLLDALRGFALFGVLLVNLRTLSLYDFLPPAEQASFPSAGIDRYINGLMAAFVDGTSVTLFTILFGVGFAMQMQRASNSAALRTRYLRRLAILLLLGLVHAYMLWWGDILRYYALLGLLLMPLARLSAKALVALGTLIVVLLPVLLQPIIAPLLPLQISSAESAAQSLVAFSSEQWQVMWQGNLSRDLRMRIAVWILPSYIYGRMLIGVALGNSGMLSRPEHFEQRWRRLWWLTLMSATVLTGLLSLRKYGLLAGISIGIPDDMALIFWQLMRNASPLVLGIFYMASFVRLYQQPKTQALLAHLAPMGQMALTCYLSQSLSAVAIFYGVGFGVGPQWGALGVIGVGVLILAIQIASCRWWMARYRFGPMEWLWRSLSYGKRQQMLRAIA